MAKKKKITASSGSDAGPKLVDSVKEILAPAPPARHPRGTKSSLLPLKIIGGILFALMLAAGVLTFYTGEGREKRGNTKTGETCQTSEDCLAGNICHAEKGALPRCLRLCRSDSDCNADEACEPRGILGKKSRVKVKNVCVNEPKP